MTMDDNRRAWLRGAYLDRIIEAAGHFASGHTYFVDAEWQAHIAGEFGYLTELSAEDHAYLRDQAGLEAFRRVVGALSSAREEAFGELIVDNVDVIESSARFALDLGWISLLQHAADRVRTYPEAWKVQLVGGKEKFGCLVLHIDCDYDQRGCRSEVERLREEVRLRSLATCEICGEPGRLRLSGFAKTVCDQHSGVMGEFREDDGKWSDPWKWNEERPLEDYIDHVLDFGRALIAEVEHQKRPSCDESTDPIRSTSLGRRIDDDTWQRVGREQELLVEFGWHIQDAVNGAAVKVEYLDGYVHEEVAGWREFAVQPLTPADEEFLQGYLRALIEEEYERIKNNR